MATKEENELLTRTGPGAPMGKLFRRYWIPALLSSELAEPDGPPVRVKLLGETLAAFRDTKGRIGLLDEFCAHRRASLFLGRNEECGLRCVYHGWKYDVEGHCVEMPNEPPQSDFKHKVHLKAYPTVELGDIIWAYLGPEEKIPPPPKFLWTQVSSGQRLVSKVWQECNWLQATEGNLDTIHASFLHRKLTPHTKRAGINVGSLQASTKLKLDVKISDYGLFYAGIRSLNEKENYVIVNLFVMPMHQQRALTSGGYMKQTLMEGHTVVPMNDENCMDWVWRCTLADDSREEMEIIEANKGRAAGEARPDFRKTHNRDNDWLIDRQVQKAETFTGIEGINTQDHAVQESMGRIMDRTREHLGSTDRAIVAARHLLMQGMQTVENGKDPLGTGTSYYTVRPVAAVLPVEANWLEVLGGDLYLSEVPSGATSPPTQVAG